MLAAAAVLVVATAIGGMVVASGGERATATSPQSPASTATVQRGDLADKVSQAGILTFRARSDGSPYVVINQAGGIYTKLPDNGDTVDCGGVLYRVDDKPVVLLCGTVPAYRDLHTGEAGKDVHQLNRNLHDLGYDAGAHVRIDPRDGHFTAKTEAALEKLQQARGLDATGALDVDDAVFLPDAVRIAKVTGQLGGPAQRGAPVLSATSTTPEVQIDLDPSQPGALKKGERAQITLPDNSSVAGTVDRIGAVVQAPAGQAAGAGSVTIPAYIRLDDPARARGLDQAPVQVDVATKGVQDALSVPVTALVGKSGGGFAVEVAGSGGRRELVAVKLGLFDTADGRVQVEGDLREGDDVVVPSL
ncbi:MAG TPA: efflux RND transporter periplasmic adaptor subunit [Solirubrobacteraceae bacterium]|nr:efflux RND transporter periplasmic adaptor subunit [Solirubrobacteraceae bacterium]